MRSALFATHKIPPQHFRRRESKSNSKAFLAANNDRVKVRSASRPQPVNLAHDLVCETDCVCDRRNGRGNSRRAGILSKPPGCEDCGSNQQDAFAAFVHARKDIPFAFCSSTSEPFTFLQKWSNITSELEVQYEPS